MQTQYIYMYESFLIYLKGYTFLHQKKLWSEINHSTAHYDLISSTTNVTHANDTQLHFSTPSHRNVTHIHPIRNLYPHGYISYALRSRTQSRTCAALIYKQRADAPPAYAGGGGVLERIVGAQVRSRAGARARESPRARKLLLRASRSSATAWKMRKYIQ